MEGKMKMIVKGKRDWFLTMLMEDREERRLARLAAQEVEVTDDLIVSEEAVNDDLALLNEELSKAVFLDENHGFSVDCGDF